MRQTQGAMLCPHCRKLISVSVERCPFCGTPRPGLWGFGPALSRFLRVVDPASLLPAVCIVLYVASLLLDLRAVFRLDGGAFGLLSPGGRALRMLGSTAPVDLVAGRWWTVLTAIYLHGGLLHILFNVLWIRSLAPDVQRAFGSARFFVIWSVAGASGFLLSDGLPILGIGPPHASIGASGSIFGLMAALIVYGRAVGASLMTRQLWTWALVMGFMGFLMPGVDNLAHVGGFAGGYLAASLYRTKVGRPDGSGSTLLALGLLLLTLAGFALSLAVVFLRLSA
jgi:rhomboid protease GluP